MNEDFKICISSAVKSIELKDFEGAKVYIQKALLQRINAPEPFNLLGILEEYKGNFLQACKYYRAAYALDPTYKAVANNLDRVTGMQYGQIPRHIDFGNRIDECEKDMMYYVEYDSNHVGHIKKNIKDLKKKESK